MTSKSAIRRANIKLDDGPGDEFVGLCLRERSNDDWRSVELLPSIPAVFETLVAWAAGTTETAAQHTKDNEHKDGPNNGNDDGGDGGEGSLGTFGSIVSCTY